MVAYNPDTMSNTLTRGGPLACARRVSIDAKLTSDSRKAVVLGWSSSCTDSVARPRLQRQPGGPLETQVNLSLSIGPGWPERLGHQWVMRVADPLMYLWDPVRLRTHRSEGDLERDPLNWIFDQG
jgi:hypothetical protein